MLGCCVAGNPRHLVPGLISSLCTGAWHRHAPGLLTPWWSVHATSLISPEVQLLHFPWVPPLLKEPSFPKDYSKIWVSQYWGSHACLQGQPCSLLAWWAVRESRVTSPCGLQWAPTPTHARLPSLVLPVTLQAHAGTIAYTRPFSLQNLKASLKNFYFSVIQTSSFFLSNK